MAQVIYEGFNHWKPGLESARQEFYQAGIEHAHAKTLHVSAPGNCAYYRATLERLNKAHDIFLHMQRQEVRQA